MLDSRVIHNLFLQRNSVDKTLSTNPINNGENERLERMLAHTLKRPMVDSLTDQRVSRCLH